MLSRAVAFDFVLCIVMFYYVFVYLRVGGVLVFVFAFAVSTGGLRSGICWRVAFAVGGGRLGGVYVLHVESRLGGVYVLHVE